MNGSKSTNHNPRRDSEINIDGLPDYRMGESADIEEIEFFSDSEEES